MPIQFPKRNTHVVLHLFSGRRRHNDVQAQLEYLTAFADYDVVALSVDVANDKDAGNLADDITVRYWLDRYSDLSMIGAIAGPPCETWTEARMNQDENVRGPPQVRSEAQPWGLDGLEEKYYK